MGYRPDDQSLQEPLDNLINNLDMLDTRMKERINNSSEWSAEHLNELVELRKLVMDLDMKFRRLRNDTW